MYNYAYLTNNIIGAQQLMNAQIEHHKTTTSLYQWSRTLQKKVLLLAQLTGISAQHTGSIKLGCICERKKQEEGALC